nr:Na/Pi cotransporter family protein [uncultured Trichococcus sp.]
MDWQSMLFQFFGGLGIFLFGLKYMGDGLQRSAGDNLRNILNKFTSTPLRSVLAGILVTVLIQSSSGTTVLAVGLVSAGFMNLEQAIGVIMGANIGTTITAFIIGFHVGAYALPIMAIGAMLLFFTKNSFMNSIGQIIFGFGCLFYGLDLMGTGMEPLEQLPQFRSLMTDLSDHPFYGVLAGTGMTLVVQSSSATVGILQELYSQNSIALDAALPILFGNNIGTTITAILAAIGASLPAKRAAASHVIFNLTGTAFILLILAPFTVVLTNLSTALNLNPAMQLAFAHGLFNVLNVLIQMWFIHQLAVLVTKMVPGEERIVKYDATNLDYTIIQTSPSVALNQAKLEVEQMGSFVTDEFHAAYKYYLDHNDLYKQDTLQLEEIVNTIDYKLTEYLTFISREELPFHSSNDHAIMIDITKYLERIGDHCENIVRNIEDATKAAKRDIRTNKNQQDVQTILMDEELVNLFAIVERNVQEAIASYVQDNQLLAEKVIQREEEVNEAEQTIRERYIQRLNSGIGLPSEGILFIDIVSNLERISDHSVKIAKHTLGTRYPYQRLSRRFIRKTEQAYAEAIVKAASLDK